jgi:haloalkane dehalogenase
MTALPEHSYVDVDGMRLHYAERGKGNPVLMLHGWPTSAYLWRDFLEPIGRSNRAIALDMPGYGRSDKPRDASYSFRFYDEALTGFLDAIGAGGQKVGLAVHDVGGPVGLHWASQNPERVRSLALLNTLVYSRPTLALIGFVIAARTPIVRSQLTSPRGIRFAMRFGVRDNSAIGDEEVAAYQEPFVTKEARKVLARAGTSLAIGGFKDIERYIRETEVPVRIVYGEKDRILPDVARTMRKVNADVGGAEVTKLQDCGHFIQEERPTEIAGMLAEFFAAN